MADQAQRMYGVIGGQNDSLSPYGIHPSQVANSKNMRVKNMEFQTCKGYAAHSTSVIRTGVTTVQELQFATRKDGTQDLVGSSDGGHWKIVGDTMTLLSTSASRGLVSSVSGTAVLGDSDARFDSDYATGDNFWMTTDGIAEAVTVSSVEAASAMTLNSSYGGSTTAGEHDGWVTQTDSSTRGLFWKDSWFFANGTDRLGQWDTSQFRTAGFPSASSACMAAPTVTAGGSLSASTQYQYKVCFQDANGDFGNPSEPATATTDGTNKTIVLNAANGTFEMSGYRGATSWPVWITKLRIYRRSATATDEIKQWYYLTAVAASLSAWADDGSISRSTSDTLPSYAIEPDVGFEDLAVIDQRLAAISGRELFISGFPPIVPHTDTAGRAEPHPWSVSHRIGDGGVSGGFSFVVLRGVAYIVGSRNIYRVNINSDDPSVWSVHLYLPNVGCVSRNSIARGGDMYYWLGRVRGRLTVLGFDGQRVLDIGDSAQGTLDTVDTAKLTEAAGGIGLGFYWLTLPITGGTYKTLEFNMDRGDGKMTWGWRDWQAQQFAQAEGKVYAAFEDGFIKELESGRSKAGAAQAYSWDTAALDLQAPEYPKHFKSMQAEFDIVNGSPDVSASYIVDEASPVALGQSPFAVSATPTIRAGVQTGDYGQRMQMRYATVGTDLEFRFRGFVFKGEVDKRDVD